MTGRKTWYIRLRIFLTLVCCACCGATAAFAQEPDGITGRVVDAAGAGVAAAKVWVVGGSWEVAEAVALTTADSKGAFSFPTLWKELKGSGALKRLSHSYSLAARDGRGRIGWLTSIGGGAQTPYTISLVELGEARGRIVDNAGQPLAGAEVAPTIFIRSDAKRLANDYVRLPPALATPLLTSTAADGSFTLRGIPAGCDVQAKVSRPGFGAPRVSWDSTKPVTITLDGRVGHIEGRLVTPDGKDLPAALSLSIRRNQPADEPTDRTFHLLYFKTESVGGDGRFRFDELPPGHYAISLESAPDCGYTADPVQDVEVGPRCNSCWPQHPAPAAGYPHRPCGRRDERRRRRRGLDQRVDSCRRRNPVW